MSIKNMATITKKTIISYSSISSIILSVLIVFSGHSAASNVSAMLKTPELAMPKSHKVTTVCNGRREVWTDYEQAKAYFLELMLSTESEERDRAECV